MTLDVVVAAARLQSLSVSVAVSTGLAAWAETQAVASEVEIRAAEQLPCSCRIRRRDLTAGGVAAGKPCQKKIKFDIIDLHILSSLSMSNNIIQKRNIVSEEWG